MKYFINENYSLASVWVTKNMVKNGKAAIEKSKHLKHQISKMSITWTLHPRNNSDLTVAPSRDRGQRTLSAFSYDCRMFDKSSLRYCGIHFQHRHAIAFDRPRVLMLSLHYGNQLLLVIFLHAGLSFLPRVCWSANKLYALYLWSMAFQVKKIGRVRRSTTLLK